MEPELSIKSITLGELDQQLLHHSPLTEGGTDVLGEKGLTSDEIDAINHLFAAANHRRSQGLASAGLMGTPAYADGGLPCCCSCCPCSSRSRFGGGCRDIEAKVLNTLSGPMVIAHLLVDCRDAMGANAVNTMAESIAPAIEHLTGGTVILRIISNLAIHRLARVSEIFTPEEMGGKEQNGDSTINGIIQAYHFAAADPFRATTHNKGIMNAISAIAIACGQDWRAIESGAHSYAAHNRTYSSLTTWKKDASGNLIGSIELPMAVGLIGGAIRVHPGAKANVALLGTESANELAAVMAASGLAQNLGALRALATVGIQAGHMKLHVRNMAASAGAKGSEVDEVASKLRSSGTRITMASVEAAIKDLRSNNN